jgi:hypothetical protein
MKKRPGNFLRICLPLLCACLLAGVLFGSLFSTVHAAALASQTLSISKVYTTDTNQQTQGTFAQGSQIYYHVDFNNSGPQIPIVVNILVQMGHSSIFDDNFNFTAPAGPTRLYTPATIPSNAPTGDYNITYLLSQNGASQSNGAVGTGRVTVSPFPEPVGTPTPPTGPSGLTNCTSNVSMYTRVDGNAQHDSYVGVYVPTNVSALYDNGKAYVTFDYGLIHLRFSVNENHWWLETRGDKGTNLWGVRTRFTVFVRFWRQANWTVHYNCQGSA